MACGCGGDDERPPSHPPRPLGLGISHPDDPDDDIEYAKATYQLLVKNMYRAYRDLGYSKKDAVRRTSDETKVRVKIVRVIVRRYEEEEEKKKKDKEKRDNSGPSTSK